MKHKLLLGGLIAFLIALLIGLGVAVTRDDKPKSQPTKPPAATTTVITSELPPADDYMWGIEVGDRYGLSDGYYGDPYNDDTETLPVGDRPAVLSTDFVRGFTKAYREAFAEGAYDAGYEFGLADCEEGYAYTPSESGDSFYDDGYATGWYEASC